MAQRIAILPEHITNKIAAGEVVERPASVIKELVENALDAGATDISVEIANGGRRLIRVTDNGHGMSRDDALLALERHATSKIRSDRDLEGILSLGFRGEALPSIASVSRFRLATREPGTTEGTEICVEGGRVSDVRACGMPSGTAITVEQLFFNTPARLKFLRSLETEAGHVADTVTRMAISRPDVSFCCINDGKEVLRVQAGDMLRRLATTVGKDAAADLYPVETVLPEGGVSGFISGPATVRSTTAGMFTYVNGRFVRDKVVQHAIMQAYRGVIDRGRYPVVALFLSIPAGEVDVNVHPTKHEVRFRNQKAVHDLLQAAVEQVLAASPWVKVPTVPRPVLASEPDAENRAARERVAAAAQAFLAMPARPAVMHYRSPSAPPMPQPAAVAEPAPLFQPEGAEPVGYFSSLGVIGQFHGEYLLCQAADDLVVIDQHAAAERVAYQRLVSQFTEGGVESQRLLFPETLELSHAEAAASRLFRADLCRLGFDLEDFGGNTVIVSAVPRIAAGSGVLALVSDLLAELEGTGSSAAFHQKIEHLLSTVACHSVIRGATHLDRRQIGELLAAMDRTDFAASCPHGRPVFHKISRTELEKVFKR